jgi:hypothetical protein
MAAPLARAAREPAVRDVLERSAVLDAEQVLIARDRLLGAPDLLAVYLPGLDIAQHELLQRDDATSISASALADRLDAIRQYYVFLDGLVDELLKAGPTDVVGLVTHPGRVGNAAPTVDFSGGPIDPNVAINYAPEGVPALRDVAPTVLRLLGLPVSRELVGRWDRWPLTPEFSSRYPVQYVDSYGQYAVDVPAAEGKPLDEETLERLRSLGYIR